MTGTAPSSGASPAREATAVARLVGRGYDVIGPAYLEMVRRSGSGHVTEHCRRLDHQLEAGGQVLDLGCGAGVPAAALLSVRHHVVALDVSAGQAGAVRRHAPGASPLVADAACVAFPPASFDAIVCFYTLTHVPRRLHGALLRRMARWLRPAGRLVLATGAGDHPGAVTEDFLGLGAPMYVSHYDAATNRALVEQAGFEVQAAEVREQVEDGRRVRFCWITASRP